MNINSANGILSKSIQLNLIGNDKDYTERKLMNNYDLPITLTETDNS
jgi:hypothetical protein